MRLYHNPFSSNARRVLLTAEYLRFPLDLQMIDLMSPVDRARLVEVNPNCKVPVLEDGSFVLWESCAIMQYITEVAGNLSLYPAGPQARADVNRWMFWAGQHFSGGISILTWEHLWKGLLGHGPADPQQVARGEAEVRQFGAVLDGHLARREWVSGPRITLADFAVAAPMMYLEPARLPLRQFPNVMRWFATIEALEAWRNTDVAIGFAQEPLAA